MDNIAVLDELFSTQSNCGDINFRFSNDYLPFLL